MSICVAVAHQPDTATRVLESEGWSQVPGDAAGTYHDDIAVAFIAAQYVFPRPVHGTSEGADLWQEAWPVAKGFADRVLTDEHATLLRHAESGAVLLTLTEGTKLKTGFSCLLAVPATQLRGKSYFPKLRAPTAPALSLTTVEFFYSQTVRTGLSVTSASIDSKGLGTDANIQTGIGAAFYSNVSHPKWALEP